VLRTSRFFCEDTIEKTDLSMPNTMANELLGRRVALADVVDGHVRALLHSRRLSGRIFTLSAPWPWTMDPQLAAGVRSGSVTAADLAARVRERFFGTAEQCCYPSPTSLPACSSFSSTSSPSSSSASSSSSSTPPSSSQKQQQQRQKQQAAWRLPREVTRIYDSSAALGDLGWRPRYTFDRVLELLNAGDPVAVDGLY
jgi:UDP-glucose 4-epimerase